MECTNNAVICSNDCQIFTNVEIKKEPEWLERMQNEVKPKSEESAVSYAGLHHENGHNDICNNDKETFSKIEIKEEPFWPGTSTEIKSHLEAISVPDPVLQNEMKDYVPWMNGTGEDDLSMPESPRLPACPYGCLDACAATLPKILVLVTAESIKAQDTEPVAEKNKQQKEKGKDKQMITSPWHIALSSQQLCDDIDTI